jgi:tetratricopeptide (TPR) repeat protein/GGDEF domain-containing protein
MRYIGQYFRAVCALFLVQVSQSAGALSLTDPALSDTLKNAFALRDTAPLSCINTAIISINTPYNSHPRTKRQNSKNFAIQLQAYCYAQLGEYSKALDLLQPILKNPGSKNDQIETLNIIALEIPQEERPQLSNADLIKRLNEQIATRQPLLISSINLTITRLLTIIKLNLEEDNYQDAHNALEKTKKLLKNNNNKNNNLHAWLDYYQGLYFVQIKQEQLASLHFLSADKSADQHGFIKLSGQVKNSIILMYQKKYRFTRALDFSNRRIELYMETKNTPKQVESIIQFAVLKRQNNEHNQALIYLLNALELIEENSYSTRLGGVYLEIGRTYAEKGSNENNQKELALAQKYLQNARFHFKRSNKVQFQIESLLLLAKLNIFNNSPARAILQLEKVLQLAAQDHPLLRAQAYKMLALSYEITGSPQLAILHFKNFYSLQNKIKENAFKLQQLQINEQLQLLEEVQQQNRLEIQNTALQKKSNFYKILSYTAISLFILSALMLLSRSKRYHKLRVLAKQTQQRLAFHGRSKLPTQENDINDFKTLYNGTPLFYALVNVPFLTELNELYGVRLANKIEAKLGETLKIQFADSVNIFHLRDNQILFISEQNNTPNAAGFADKIEQFFDNFATRYQLPKTISTGIVAYPFLNKASRAISPTQTLNLNSLALFAASQIRSSKQQNSWVELYAIDNLQPAFFDGDLWRLGQIAISKGLVKIHSSNRDDRFSWPELENKKSVEQVDQLLQE